MPFLYLPLHLSPSHFQLHLIFFSFLLYRVISKAWIWCGLMNRFFSLFFLQFRLLNWYILTLCVCCACLRIYVKDHNKGKHRSLSETQSNTISQAIIPPPLPPSTHTLALPVSPLLPSHSPLPLAYLPLFLHSLFSLIPSPSFPPPRITDEKEKEKNVIPDSVSTAGKGERDDLNLEASWERIDWIGWKG